MIQPTVKATFERRTADLPFRVRNWLICFSDLLHRNRADRSSLTKRMPDAMPSPNGNLGKTRTTTHRVHSATYCTTGATHHSPRHRGPWSEGRKQSGKRSAVRSGQKLSNPNVKLGKYYVYSGMGKIDMFYNREKVGLTGYRLVHFLSGWLQANSVEFWHDFFFLIAVARVHQGGKSIKNNRQEQLTLKSDVKQSVNHIYHLWNLENKTQQKSSNL